METPVMRALPSILCAAWSSISGWFTGTAALSALAVMVPPLSEMVPHALSSLVSEHRLTPSESLR